MTRGKDVAPDDAAEELDPRLEAGWRELETGDVAAARAAAAAAMEDPAIRADALVLTAACAREVGDFAAAMEALGQAATEDPDWCTPELWMAELLAADSSSGRLGEALRHARRALDRAEEEDEFLGALICKAAVELELGRPTEARRTLRGLPAADLPLDNPEATLEVAELLVEAGDPAEARERVEALVAVEPDFADAWYVLGLAAEAAGDEEAKRKAWIKTRELDLRSDDDEASADAGEDPGESGNQTNGAGDDEDDDDGPGDGPSLTEETLVAVAEETLASLPDELRRLLENVPIVVAELPAAADVAAGLDPRLLGLFSGSPHADGAVLGSAPSLTEIVLFRKNIERVGDDEEHLREEIRTTLLHEAGHFFGFDEEALARLGLD